MLGEEINDEKLSEDPSTCDGHQALSALDVMIMQGADFAALTKSSTLFGELLEDVLEQRSSSGDVTQPSDGRTVKEAPDAPATSGALLFVGVATQAPRTWGS